MALEPSTRRPSQAPAQAPAHATTRATAGPAGMFGLLLCVLLTATACNAMPAAGKTARLEVVDVLGGRNTAGFERALRPRDFDFPLDHGAHPSFASEWWYFTGNLAGEGGGRFGYQLTFFRISLTPPENIVTRASAWAGNQVWMAHFALTDIESERFFAFDRFQRGALGLAGAQASPWRVWLDDWSLEQVGEEPFPLRLRARQRTGGGDSGELVAIDLTLSTIKPVVLQGERGLSRKGPTPGNASYYYSYTRLQTEGVVQTGDEAHRVAGTSWLDREWGTSALEEGQVGWDWFALQLSDGTELMYYQLRQAGGAASPQSTGVLVSAGGDYATLPPGSVVLEVQDEWKSPLDGVAYPSGWVLSIPGRGIVLRIEPVLDAQELDVAFRYWEGAVVVSGTGPHGRAVSGRGYAELTGYAGDGLHP